MKQFWLLCVLLPRVMHAMNSHEAQKWDGEFYNTHARPMFHAGKKHVERISFDGCYSVADIGCGSGAITALIADTFPRVRVVGCDVSADMIRAARKHHGSRENLTFCEQDAQKNVGNNEYDLAVSFLTLHWVANKSSFFTALFKALKPGGRFYLTAGTKKPEIEELKKKFFAALFAHDPQWQFLMGTSMVTANNAISQDEVAQHCTHAGFTDVTITQEVEHHTFGTVQELANFVGTFISGYKDIADLPAHKRQEFISTAAQLWTTVCADGKPSYTWANLVVQGRKPGA